MQAVQDPIVPDYVHGLQRITDFAEIEEVMKSPEFQIDGADERFIFLDDTLLMSDGQRHSEQKRLFAPLMSRQALAYYELKLVEPVVRQSIAEHVAKKDAQGVVRLDLVPLIHAALTRISARVTGVDGVDTEERTNRFRKLVLVISAATTASFSRAADPKGMIQQGRDAMQSMIDEFLSASLLRRRALVAQHRAGEIGLEDLPRDMLTTMCLADDLARDDDGEKIPYVWRQCALFLTASIKTTSHALPHVFMHIDEWMRAHPEDQGKQLDPEWLHQAAAESFRLHQSAPVRFRRAVKDLTLSTGRQVARGERLAIHTPIANLSDAVFGPDARYFNPNRTVPDGLKPWGMTFGMGTHACLGQNLVTGMQNKGDEKHGTHGTAVCMLKALYEMGATLDPDHPARRPEGNLHDVWETVPILLHTA